MALSEDVKEMELDWKDAKSIAGNFTKWRTLVVQCSRENGRIKVSLLSDRWWLMVTFFLTEGVVLLHL